MGKLSELKGVEKPVTEWLRKMIGLSKAMMI
jgi:hypothetical protein